MKISSLVCAHVWYVWLNRNIALVTIRKFTTVGLIRDVLAAAK